MKETRMQSIHMMELTMANISRCLFFFFFVCCVNGFAFSTHIIFTYRHEKRFDGIIETII